MTFISNTHKKEKRKTETRVEWGGVERHAWKDHITHTGIVLGPRRPLMKAAAAAESGTPAPIARNPAAMVQSRNSATVKAFISGIERKEKQRRTVRLDNVRTLVRLGGVDDAVLLVPVEEGDVPLQRREVRRGGGLLAAAVAPWSKSRDEHGDYHGEARAANGSRRQGHWTKLASLSISAERYFCCRRFGSPVVNGSRFGVPTRV
jgi:hypothetical protein